MKRNAFFVCGLTACLAAAPFASTPAQTGSTPHSQHAQQARQPQHAQQHQPQGGGAPVRSFFSNLFGSDDSSHAQHHHGTSGNSRSSQHHAGRKMGGSSPSSSQRSNSQQATAQHGASRSAPTPVVDQSSAPSRAVTPRATAANSAPRGGARSPLPATDSPRTAAAQSHVHGGAFSPPQPPAPPPISARTAAAPSRIQEEDQPLAPPRSRYASRYTASPREAAVRETVDREPAPRTALRDPVSPRYGTRTTVAPSSAAAVRSSESSDVAARPLPDRGASTADRRTRWMAPTLEGHEASPSGVAPREVPPTVADDDPPAPLLVEEHDVLAPPPAVERAPAVSASSRRSTSDSGASTQSKIHHRDADDSLPPGLLDSTPKAEVLSSSGMLFQHQSPAIDIRTFGPRQIVLGQQAEYVINVANGGQAAAKDLELTVSLPEWAEIDETSPSLGTAKSGSPSRGKSVVWTIKDLAPADKAELSLKLRPKSGQPIELAVQLTSAPSTSDVSIDVREPKLQLALAGPQEVEFGEKAVYELTFANPGNADAQDVIVRLLPIEPGDEPDEHQIGTIPAGAKKVVEIELIARQAGMLHIQAEAFAEGGLKSQVVHDVTVQRAELAMQVRGPEHAFAGTEAEYTLHVKNAGNGLARDVEVGAVLPNGAVYVSCSGDGKKEADENSVLWNLGHLQPGAEQVLTVKVELTQDGANRLEAAAVGKGDIKDSGQAITQVEAVGDLDLIVRDPKGPVPTGKEATYEVVVKNIGSKDAENIEISGYFSRGIEPTGVEGREHEITGDGRVVISPIGRLAAGEEVVIKVVSKAFEPGNHTFRAEVVCQDLDIKLGVQETTRFYGESLAPTQSAGPAAIGEEESELETAPPLTDDPAADSSAEGDAAAEDEAPRYGAPPSSSRRINRYENAAPAGNGTGAAGDGMESAVDRYRSRGPDGAAPVEPAPLDAGDDVTPLESDAPKSGEPTPAGEPAPLIDPFAKR